MKRDDDGFLAKKFQAEAEEWEKQALVIEADILKCDERMTSGNVYPRAEVERAVAELQESCLQGRVLGMFDPTNQQSQVMLSESSHTVESIWLSEEGTVTARLRLIPTDRGKQLVEFIRAGGTVKMAPRGFGNIVDGKVEGYQIITVDIYRDLES